MNYPEPLHCSNCGQFVRIRGLDEKERTPVQCAHLADCVTTLYGHIRKLEESMRGMSDATQYYKGF